MFCYFCKKNIVMEIVLLALGLVAFAFLLLGFNIFVSKKPFPDTHVGHNKEMKKLNIVCAKTMDRMEQKKMKDEMREEFKFKNLTLATED